MPQLIQVFDVSGDQYEEAFKVFLKHTNQKDKARIWLDRLVRSLAVRKTFIDAGAGTGQMTAWYTDLFQNTIAIEPNSSLFKDLQETCPKADLHLKKILDMKLDPTGDLILCSHVLYYVDREEWIPTAKRLASWLSPTGVVAIALQNPGTDCMKLLEHFYHRGFSLSILAQELEVAIGKDFEIRIERVPALIKTNDLETTYKISEFILNLVPTEYVPTEHRVKAYIEKHFKTEKGRYEMSCDQDFLTIRRKP